jgi:hypothetical protein
VYGGRPETWTGGQCYDFVNIFVKKMGKNNADFDKKKYKEI